MRGSRWFLGVALLVCAGGHEMKASTVSTWVQAISSACICNGLPWDVGSSFNTGQKFGAGSVAYEISGPFTDNYLYSGGSQYAEGWSSANTAGVLKAFSQVNATTPIPEVFADGHSYWGATIQATCDPNVPGTVSAPSCSAGSVTFHFGLQLHDTLIAGNYGQYGGGAFVNYDGAGALASLAIHDGNPHPAGLITRYLDVTVPVGTYLDIGADLTAQTQAQQGYATADASSTGLFSLQVLTPGGGYTTQGGVVFAASFNTAPEPGTFAAGGLGCLFLLLVARKSR